MQHLLKGPPNTCHPDMQLQLVGNLYAININVNTAQAANVARAVEGRRFHGVPPPKASYVTLHRRNNSSLKTDHGGRLVSRSGLRFCRSAVCAAFSGLVRLWSFGWLWRRPASPTRASQTPDLGEDSPHIASMALVNRCCHDLAVCINYQPDPA